MPKVKLKTRVCPACGKIDKGPSRYINTEYCSRDCWRSHGAGKHLRTGHTVNCQTCTKPFYIRGAYVKRNRHFCSWKCYSLSRRIMPQICKTCRKQFVPRDKGQTFCGYSCSKTAHYNPNWLGGFDPRHYNKPYFTWRRKVFLRDKRTCQACGATQCRIHAHHLKSYALFPKLRYVVSNGVTLCETCHFKTYPGRGQKRHRQQFLSLKAT